MRTYEFPYRLRIGDTVYVVEREGASIITGKVGGLTYRFHKTVESVQVNNKWYEQYYVTPNPYMAELFMEHEQAKFDDYSCDVSSLRYQNIKHLEELMHNLIEIELHLGMREDPDNKFVASKENNG